MKRTILLALVLIIPLVAQEIWLGMVGGCAGDSLVLVDGRKVYVKNLQFNRYVTRDNQPIDATRITFPFTASLITNEKIPEHLQPYSVRIKIHTFYDIRNGRLTERTYSR